MSILMMLAMSRRIQRDVTQTFTANGTWIAPTNVVSMSGYGARGQNATSQTIARYNKQTTFYSTRRSNGQVVTTQGTQDTLSGSPPANYCDAPFNTPTDPEYSSVQVCYTFSDASTVIITPATTGASATFSPASGGTTRTFPGSTGNVQPATTTFTNIAVVQGASHNIVVPTGGTITLTWRT